MAQFVLTIKKATEEKYWKPQDIVMSDAKKEIKYWMTRGNQQTANPDTLAIAMFNTFRYLCRCFFSALADCSPGFFCDFSFKKMIM